MSKTLQIPMLTSKRLKIMAQIAIVFAILAGIAVAIVPFAPFFFLIAITSLILIAFCGFLISRTGDAQISALLIRLAIYLLIWSIMMAFVVMILNAPYDMFDRVILVANSSLIIFLFWCVSLILPIWIIEIEPGDVVLVFSPLKNRSKYRYMAAPLGAKHPVTNMGGDAENPPQTVGNPADLVGDGRWIWIAPIEKTRLIWQLQRHITVPQELSIYDHIYTKDGVPLSIKLKTEFEFDPSKIKEKSFAMFLGKVESPEFMHKTLIPILHDGVEQALRRHYIEVDFQSARTSATHAADGLTEILKTRLAWMENILGIRYLSDFTIASLTEDPTADRKMRDAALANVNTNIELNKIQRLVALARGGDYEAKMLFAFYMMENSNMRFRHFPNIDSAMPSMSEVEKLLQSESRLKQLMGEIQGVAQVSNQRENAPAINAQNHTVINTPNSVPPVPSTTPKTNEMVNIQNPVPPVAEAAPKSTNTGNIQNPAPPMPPPGAPKVRIKEEIPVRVWHRCEDYSFVFYWENVSENDPIRLIWDGKQSQPITSPSGKFDTGAMKVNKASYEIINKGKVVSIISERVNCSPTRND